MPTIVMARRMAVITCPSASHQPASTSQIRFPINPKSPVPTSSTPENSDRDTAVCPKGRSVYSAMLKAARVHGNPMIVIAIIIAATIQATAIQSPPQTIQSAFSKNENIDIGHFPVKARLGCSHEMPSFQKPFSKCSEWTEAAHATSRAPQRVVCAETGLRPSAVSGWSVNGVVRP